MFRWMGKAEFRYGSRYSEDSKLEVVRSFSTDPETSGKTVIRFDFYENITADISKDDLNKLISEFDKQVSDLLTKKM